MAKIISGATKRGQQLLRRASHWEGTDLSDVYGRYSVFKASAIKECREWCEADEGWDFHITSHNTSGFCVAWRYTNKETGEVMTRIETPKSTYIVDGARKEN